jgi:hypothetical protein
MNPEIKKQWVEALRSRKYKQGQSQLRKVDEKGRSSFCCLGVLCNLHAQAHPEVAAYETDPQEYLGAFGFPPAEVVEWAGLDDEDPAITYKGELSSLASLNDGRGLRKPLTFGQIARIIERQL